MKKKFNNEKDVALFLHHNLKQKTNLIISGGNTIKSLMAKMISLNKNLYFKNLLLSDERIVNKNSINRNDKFFKKLISNKVINTKNFIHYEQSKLDYLEIKRVSQKISKTKFNNCLLSLGSNCHLASIFDFNFKSISNFYHIDNSPKKPKNRVTVSKEVIFKCNKIFLVAKVHSKKKELKQFFKIAFFKKIKKKIILLTY